LTCPRPGGVRYVDELLSGLAAAVSEVDLIVVEDSAGYLMRPPNNTAAGWSALASAAARRDWLLFLEDDVRPLVPFLWSLTHKIPEGAAFSSLCRSRNQPLGVRSATLFAGSQAVLFSAETVQRLFDLGPPAIVGFDMAIATAGQMLSMNYEQGPSYFHHVGTVSAADPRIL
jgi:hypothetical protein